MTRVFGILVVVLVSFAVNAAPPSENPTAPAPVAKALTFDGKVVPLADALKKLGAKPDADTTGVALVGADGNTYTLVKDATSRLLFMDKELHGREFRLTGKVLTGTTMLQVTKVQTIKNGKLFNVDYWCDECQLEASEPGACKCCGGPTTLRELPAK